MLSFPSHFFSSKWGTYFIIHYLPDVLQYKELHAWFHNCHFCPPCLTSERAAKDSGLCRTLLLVGYWKTLTLPKQRQKMCFMLLFQTNDFFQDVHFSNACLFFITWAVDGNSTLTFIGLIIQVLYDPYHFSDVHKFSYVWHLGLKLHIQLDKGLCYHISTLYTALCCHS